METNQQSGAEKQVKLALDLVERGDDTNDYGQYSRVSKQLPPDVSSKMLYKDVVRIAWPAFVEFTLTQLTSMADMMMVGQLGPWAIAAVGLTVQPKFLMATMFMAMNVGATALIARAKGAGDPERANRVLRQALLLTTIFGTIAAVVGFVYSETLIRFMGAADEQTLAGGTIYLKIQMAGFVFLAMTSTFTAALRGVGSSRITMTYNLISNVANVVFNYILIYGKFGFPRWGVAGASLATVIGQTVAFVMALIVVLRGRHYIHLQPRAGFKPEFKTMKSIVSIGFPAMIEQLLMRAGAIMFVKTVASLGTVPYATHQIGMNIQALSFMNGQAFAVSATSLVGQSLGKKRPDMAQAYARRTRMLGMMVSVLLGITFFFFGRQIVSWYTKEEEVITMGARILKLVALTQPFQSSQFILAGALRGAGDTRAIAIIIFITVLLIRPGLAMININVFQWGLMGAWIALVTDQVLRSALILLRYNSGKWKSIKV
ncbi:MAG: MATE family efflux transporter [Bacillota bacterium]|nr:MATE family efflux transporter [Bacillota bacterium]NLL88486.1 MATE family efflux transporter [Bacillota bacterium]HKM16671.1 MATE family efflux transporter [Limnochordia bacterium]